jgi:nucleolar GTP-binding protein
MGGQTLETFIPDGVKGRKKYDKTDPERRRLARDEEEENGGAGVFNVDMRADYMLANDEWKHDKIPEIFDGKNVYDFVDPDIEAKLAALEEEEEKLEAEGFYESDEDIEDDEEADVMRKAELIREKQQLIRNEARMKKRLKNQAIIPRKSMKKNLSEFEDALDALGVDTTEIAERARSKSRPRGRSMSRSRLGTEDPDAMDVDRNRSQTPRDRARSKSRAPTTNRLQDGVQDDLTRSKAERIAKLNQKRMNRMARQGEADRHTTASITKHLVSLTLFSFILTQGATGTNTQFSRSPESVVWARLSADNQPTGKETVSKSTAVLFLPFIRMSGRRSQVCSGVLGVWAWFILSVLGAKVSQLIDRPDWLW